MSSSWDLIPPVATAQICSLALFLILVHLYLVSADRVLVSLAAALASIQLLLHLTRVSEGPG